MSKNPADLLPKSLISPDDRLLFLALAGSAATALVSVVASEILLAGASAGALWLTFRRGERRFEQTPLLCPFLALFGWTVLSALVSSDIRLGLGIIKKFFWFLIPFLVPTLLRGTDRIRWFYQAIFAVAIVSAANGLRQFIENPHRGLLDRISGFMGQWMTYSGLLMLVLVTLVAYGSCLGWRKRWWAIPLCLILIGPILLSETRNAWAGVIAGVLVILALLRPRTIGPFLALILVFFLLAPDKLQRRLRAGWNPDDPNTANRLELVGTSLRLIQDNPWFGVGPKNVNREALRYRGNEEYPDWLYQHMHNNFLQIAAERGIPGLLLWLVFMGRLAWDALRVFRRARGVCSPESPGGTAKEALLASTAALGAWAALLIAGLFEYNFGDSEVLALFLYIMSVPYAFLPDRKSIEALT